MRCDVPLLFLALGFAVLLAGCDANRYTGPTAWHPVRLSLRGRREQTS